MVKDNLKLQGVRGENVELPPHELSCDLENLRSYAITQDKPLAIDLFCGAGGLSLGLEDAGYSVILGVDSNRNAIATHRANFGGCSLLADLSDPGSLCEISKALSDISVSLVAGGPPCQPFSLAGRYKIRSLVEQGKRPEHDERKDLWRRFLECVHVIQPETVLIENVPDMALGANDLVFRQIVKELDSLGYYVYAKILAAWEYGVPQHRRRLFVVGTSSKTDFDWPVTSGNLVTVSDAISDLPRIKGGVYKNPRNYRGPKTGFQRHSRRGIDGDEKGKIYDHFSRPVREDDLEAFKLMVTGERYTDLPAHLRRYRADTFTDKYNRLDWNGLSRTITAHIAKDGYWYIHPRQQRTLSVREAARLQTFPDSFRFSGFRTNAYQQIGEAVPSLLGKELGLSILQSKPDETESGINISTGRISEVLTNWLTSERNERLSGPWRTSGDFWLTLLGMVVFEDISVSGREKLWSSYRDRWYSVEKYLGDRRRRASLKSIGREKRFKTLEKVAREIKRLQGDHFSEPLKVKGVSQNKIQMARFLCGIDDGVPYALRPARVAGRVLSTSSEDDDFSDVNSRLRLARVVGVSDASIAYAALFEVGDRYCTATSMNCCDCPLNEVCVTGSKNYGEIENWAEDGCGELTYGEEISQSLDLSWD